MEYSVTNLTEKSIQVLYCGHMACKPGHRWGPSMRDHVLLHFVISGKGTYRCGRTVFQIGPGQSFFLFPGIPAEYEADRDDPWEYSWVAFSGESISSYLELSAITPEQPVHRHADPAGFRESLSELIGYAVIRSIPAEMKMIGTLYRMLADILEGTSAEGGKALRKLQKQKEWYLEKAVQFIRARHTMPRLTVSVMAEHVGLERSYFAKLFTEGLGETPHQFLLRFRLEKASGLLTFTDLPVASVALSVGFEDPLYFTKVFKRQMGRSPSEFRKESLRKEI